MYLGEKAEAQKQAAAGKAAADIKHKAPANNRTGKKSLAAASNPANANNVDAEQSPAAAASKHSTEQTGKAPNVIDLLTPVDFIKKSSANRAKQKQPTAQDQQMSAAAAEAAPSELARAAPAGKKVATRGRNANLQVVDVEPKAKPRKRKTASETADKLAPGSPEEAADAPEQEKLPNRKRSKPSKSLPQEAIEAAGPETAVLQLQQPESRATALRDVPGLPGVRHQMAKVAIAATAAKDADPAHALPQTAASENRSQSGATKSTNSRRQASSGKAGTSKAAAAEVTQPDLVPGQQPVAANAANVDKPADRAVAVAMQPTLASAGVSHGMQFHKLQVSHCCGVICYDQQALPHATIWLVICL